MEFKKLYLQNFLTVGTASINLADRGLNLIQGLNEDDGSADSNGAGKSSLVDGLCWALYGVTARNVKGDKVVNRTAKKETFVKLVMQNGDSLYSVERFRKHSAFKNQLHIHVFNPASGYESGEKGIPLHKGTEAETQKELETILGCRQDVFMAAVYAGQERMPDLPNKTDKELKVLVEEAAGLQRIERAYQVALKRLTAAKGARDTAVAKRDTNEANMVRTMGSLRELADQAVTFEKDRAMRVDVAKVDVAKRGVDVAVAKTAWDVAEADRTHAEPRIADLQAQLAAHASLQKAATVAREAAHAADRAIDRHGLQLATEQVARVQKDLDDAPAAIAKPCDACGKPHTADELEEFKAHLTKLLLDRQAKLAAVKAKVREQATASLVAKQVADEAAAIVPDVSTASKELTKLRNVLAIADEWKRAHDRAVMDLEAAKVRLEARKSEPNPFKSGVDALKTQYAALVATKAELDEALERANKRLDIAETVVKLFGPAGVRAEILDTVTPYLNARTADYLSVLSDGNMQATWTTLTRSAAGDLKEKFSIDTVSATGAESFDGLSGGEKRKVRLATALALQDLVASRATQPIRLFIGDEIDDALDPAGLERLMTILERKARERGTVLVISHSDLTAWIDNVSIVKKAGGYSTVEGALVS